MERMDMSEDLINGVARFRSNVHPAMAELFGELAHGQSPDVLFLTCADSRIDPALITQTHPGELFVSRNAGNAVPPASAAAEGLGAVASIEYGVKVLGVSEIIVCGHSDCGAVKAAHAGEPLTALPAVDGWLRFVGAGDDAGQNLDHAIEANVRLQLDHLMSYDFVADAVAAGELRLRGWTYDIGSGEIREWSGTRFEAL